MWKCKMLTHFRLLWILKWCSHSLNLLLTDQEVLWVIDLKCKLKVFPSREWQWLLLHLWHTILHLNQEWWINNSFSILKTSIINNKQFSNNKINTCTWHNKHSNTTTTLCLNFILNLLINRILWCSLKINILLNE